MDDPAYRYSRILYPIAARGLAVGTPELIPYALLFINVLAMGLGTLALAKWLRAREASPWFALLFGLFPGLFLGFQRDLAEPLAFALVAVGVYLFDFGGRRGVMLAAVAFALAGLARETTVIFPLLFAASILAGRPNAALTKPADRSRAKQLAAGFALVALAPVAAWAAFRLGWLGSVAGAGSARVTAVPFGGLIEAPWGELSRAPAGFIFVAVPALVATAIALRGLIAGPPGQLERVCLVANVAASVAFAGSRVWLSYTGVGRASTAVVLAAVLCIPYLGSTTRPTRWALAAIALLWIALLPVVLVYGITDLNV